LIVYKSIAKDDVNVLVCFQDLIFEILERNPEKYFTFH